MKIKSKLKHMVSFLLHGETKPLYANISYLSPNKTLQGKKVVITGGGRGLGFAMAKKFKAEGAEVLIAGRNLKVLEESAQTIGCDYLQLDVLHELHALHIFPSSSTYFRLKGHYRET